MGHWSIHDRFVNNFNSDIKLSTSDRNFGAFVLHGFLGFGWDCRFSRDRFSLDLNVGYKIEDWFNHVQFFTDVSGFQANDLILQGLIASLSFRF